MPSILDRYVIREVVAPFAVALIFFTFALELQPLGSVAEPLIEKGVAWGPIGRVMAMLLVPMLGLTIPMAFFVGLLSAFGRLSADREYVALQACGVSMTRLTAPAVALAFLALGASAYVSLVARPAVNRALRTVTQDLLVESAGRNVKPRVFFEGFRGLVLYVEDVGPEGWERVFLASRQDAGELSVYLAARGRLEIDASRRLATLRLEDVTSHRTERSNPHFYTLGHVRAVDVPLAWNAVFPRPSAVHVEEMTLDELRARARDLVRRHETPALPMLELHQRFSIPAASLVLALLGPILALTTRRDGKLVAFVQGIAVIFVYYAILFSGRWLALGGRLPAGAAAWAPNILLGMAALVAFRRRLRATDPSAAVIPTLGWAVVPRRARPGGRVRARLWQAGSVLRPRLLDLYVATLFARVFSLAFLALLGIFYLELFIERSPSFLRSTTTAGMVARYYWNATPQQMYYGIPLATLIATLVTVGTLVRNSELVVIRACGVSLYRTIAPLLALAAVGAVAVFVLQEGVLAAANRRAEAIFHVMEGEPARVFNPSDRAWRVGRDGTFYHYRRFDPARGVFDDLAMFAVDFQRWQITRSTFIGQATCVAGGTADMWRTRDARIWILDRPQPLQLVTLAADDPVTLEPAGYFRAETLDTELMTFPELRRYVAALEERGFNVTPEAVALQRRLSFPLATFIMVFLAVPFGVVVGHRGTVYGVGVGILLAYAYWASSSVFAAIGTVGGLPPGPSAWVPDAIFSAGALYLLLRVRT